MNDIDYDLVRTLRTWAEDARQQGVFRVERGLGDAANEIERMRARIAELEDIVAGRKPLIDGGDA